MRLLDLIDELDGEIEDVESLLERLRDGLVWAVEEIDDLKEIVAEHESEDRRNEMRLDYYLSAR